MSTMQLHLHGALSARMAANSRGAQLCTSGRGRWPATKLLIILATLFGVSVQAQNPAGVYETFTSPSGQMVAKAGIAGAEASPSTRFRVRVVLETSAGKPRGEVWTGFVRHWAATWSDDDVFLICGINEETKGEPFEFEVLDFSKKEVAHRQPTASERAKVLGEYRRKYANEEKRPNQSPDASR